MSSTRIAAVSGALLLALGAGAWTAVSAFPLYVDDQKAQPEKPPRDPLSPLTYHRQGVELFEKAQRDATLTTEQKLDVIEKGLAAEDRALDLNPDYLDAMTYKNIFLRLKANLTTDATEQQRLLTEADQLRARVIKMRKEQGLPEPSSAASAAPEMTAEFRQAIETLKPLRIGGQIKAPEKIRDVRPVYPPEALSARVQGVVIIEAVLDATGQVAAARVLRSIPLLDDAALAAVRQWAFTPPLLNGAPSAVMMTVTVNFRME